MQLGKLQERNVIAIENIRDERRNAEQILLSTKHLEDDAHELLLNLAKDMNQALDDVEYLLWKRPGTVGYTPSNHVAFKIGKVMTHIYSHWDRTTQGNLRNIKIAEIVLEEAEQKLKQVLVNEVAAFYSKATELNLNGKEIQ